MYDLTFFIKRGIQTQDRLVSSLALSNMVSEAHDAIFLFLAVSAVCLFLPDPLRADCWETGCQPNSWKVTGCGQYGRKETRRTSCDGGFKYMCCTQDAAPAAVSPVTSGPCWETGCQLDSWAVRGCEQYGMRETGKRGCDGGLIFACCPHESNSVHTPEPTTGTCWETGCQLDTWRIRGCEQYGMRETGQSRCDGGIKYKCCHVEGSGSKTVDPDTYCWETGCQKDWWAVRGCEHYNRREAGRRRCENGLHFTCCTKDGPREDDNVCWDTGCQLESWAVRGCNQYGKNEKARRPCNGGYIYTCCGKDASNCGKSKFYLAQTLISYGTKTKTGQFPWHAGLYEWKDNQYKQSCGGTIITPRIVLTAAHCVWDEDSSQVRDPSIFQVAAGKYTRSWDTRDPTEQRIQVKAILPRNAYRGEITAHEQDIAAMNLERNIDFNDIVLPICIDYTSVMNFRNGMMGTVVGWGLNENKKYSKVLKHADLPYIDSYNCRQTSPADYYRYINYDKYCAGTGEDIGVSVQKGDSGGGMTFTQNDGKVYFLYGIVSNKPPYLDRFALFTNVTEHINWLQNTVMKKFADN